ncbi:MAG: dimethylamine monooxygenase subunit DmmA family protein [Paracoccaceae bacterium]
MTKTVFEPAIKSRPVYGELQPRAGLAHLMVADGEGGQAIVDLIAKAGADAAQMLARSHIIYMPGPNGTDLSAAMQALGAAQYRSCPSFAAAHSRISKVLADAHMGLQVYLAGTEGLMGQVMTEAVAAGLPGDAVQTEHRGSTVRRVQCVHCKGITENVRLDPFKCSHCGLNLFVRDHYSHRIAAFQGVCIDAEDPGVVPPAVERFK